MLQGNPLAYSRFYIDLACWTYIGLIIVTFLIFKLIFLLFAWKNPETYLKYKSVIWSEFIDLLILVKLLLAILLIYY